MLMKIEKKVLFRQTLNVIKQTYFEFHSWQITSRHLVNMNWSLMSVCLVMPAKVLTCDKRRLSK